MTELELAGSPSSRRRTQALSSEFWLRRLKKKKKNDCTQHGLESSKSLTGDSKGDEGVEWAGLTISSSLTFGLLSGPKKNLQRSL